MPIVLSEEKERLITELRGLFERSDTLKLFENGSGYHWAVITVGSLGRLGTAIKGNCNWNAIVLSDMPDSLLEKSLSDLAARLNGNLQYGGGVLPTVVFGKDADYYDIFGKPGSNGNKFSCSLAALLKNYGIGSPAKGIATIEAVSVNGHDEYAPGPGYFVGKPTTRWQIYSCKTIFILFLLWLKEHLGLLWRGLLAVCLLCVRQQAAAKIF